MCTCVPASDVTCIDRLWRNARMALRTDDSKAGSGTVRSRISGCSLETISSRGTFPSAPFMITGNSGACNMPSTVQSTMNEARAIAATTGPNCCRACVAPVERTGTGALSTGDGILISNGRAPIASSAKRARSTFTRRDCVSDTMATISPACTWHRLKVR